MNRIDHWDGVYARRAVDDVSWFQERPERSLAWIAASGMEREAALIDVGGGASTLVDHLVERGYCDLTVLDVSASALQAVQARLGEAAARVHWIVSDITAFEPARPYRLWHDRAVFHFLTEAADRVRYVAALTRALAPGGTAIIATFADDGPQECSNLPVRRYSEAGLQAELGAGFELVDSVREVHVTPHGRGQNFVYCRFRRGT